MWIYQFYEPFKGLHTFNDEIKALNAWQNYKNIEGSFYWKIDVIIGHWKA